MSHLHRAILAIDEQARKDYAAGHLMNALSAWQNALVFCDELSQRNQLWPENVICHRLCDIYLTLLFRKQHLMKKSKNYDELIEHIWEKFLERIKCSSNIVSFIDLLFFLS